MPIAKFALQPSIVKDPGNNILSSLYPARRKRQKPMESRPFKLSAVVRMKRCVAKLYHDG
jgi:hypothetical protein